MYCRRPTQRMPNFGLPRLRNAASTCYWMPHRNSGRRSKPRCWSVCLVRVIDGFANWAPTVIYHEALRRLFRMCRLDGRALAAAPDAPLPPLIDMELSPATLELGPDTVDGHAGPERHVPIPDRICGTALASGRGSSKCRKPRDDLRELIGTTLAERFRKPADLTYEPRCFQKRTAASTVCAAWKTRPRRSKPKPAHPGYIFRAHEQGISTRPKSALRETIRRDSAP